MNTPHDPYTNDTAPDWDGAPSVATWRDLFSSAEMAAVLRLHAAQLAKRFGIYEIADELTLAADCIEELAESAK